MTSNVKLLPLPWEWDHYSGSNLMQLIHGYARANVLHHTAAQAAEIEKALASPGNPLEEAIARTQKDITAAGMLPAAAQLAAILPLQRHLSDLLAQRAELLRHPVYIVSTELASRPIDPTEPLCDHGRPMDEPCREGQCQRDPAPPVFELLLCEQRHTALRPDQLYRFRVDPECPACKALAALYEGTQ